METPEEVELCFPHINTSCRRMTGPYVETMLTYTVLSCITILTVILNLLVIISISHFKQLHTTTNLLLLSLAVADFLVGLLQMPLLLLNNEGCWLLGDILCVVHYFFAGLVVSVSVGCMVLISVDRYIAICNPMFYTTRVTLTRVKLCVCLCWIFSVVHCSWILRDVLKQPDMYNTCYGSCVVVIGFAEGLVDIIATFLGPILIISVLYLRVFVVAVSQARAMRSHIAVVTVERSQTVKAIKSEIKAARTLGIVLVVFLLCSCPYHCFAIAAEAALLGASYSIIMIWLVYLNSTFNPVIYVFFYPWVRKTIKHIFTLQILQPGSREVSVM
uniref:trace amine-associated receptor 13c-like isoform X1 n=1 Tax=Solea senegalensis TaxID=28829 RepID=UPI001CD885AC|nr:trace amine-associated receptor 13c-like isoform X1 [Solea senegalensis]XP_043875653.1 trace amine-associated receptor 13c-like isoform X1 [Solea senegalensis]